MHTPCDLNVYNSRTFENRPFLIILAHRESKVTEKFKYICFTLGYFAVLTFEMCVAIVQKFAPLETK